jgi:hypothetical protein
LGYLCARCTLPFSSCSSIFCLYPQLFGVTQFMDHLVLCFHRDLWAVHVALHILLKGYPYNIC